MRYNGTAWRQATGSALRGAQFSDILALARGNVWVSASRYLAHRNLPLLAHLNGTRWSRVQLPWRVDPGAMAPDGRGGLWIAAEDMSGSQSWALHLSRTGRWSRSLLTSTGPVPDLALIPGTGSLWAAGAMPTAAGANAAIWAHVDRQPQAAQEGGRRLAGPGHGQLAAAGSRSRRR